MGGINVNIERNLKMSRYYDSVHLASDQKDLLIS